MASSGVSLQSDADAPAPLDQLADHAQGKLLDAYASWSGRWLLFSDTELHLDASGLLGCFYRTVHRGPEARLWVSSSLALIAALPGCEPVSPDAPSCTWGRAWIGIHHRGRDSPV